MERDDSWIVDGVIEVLPGERPPLSDLSRSDVEFVLAGALGELKYLREQLSKFRVAPGEPAPTGADDPYGDLVRNCREKCHCGKFPSS